jgi:formylglycine-generating enzyme required for sulfatase activity
MVVVPRFDGGVYCIDTTEVTYDQYKTFWNSAQATPDKQPPQCATNTTYTPSNNWPPQPEQLKKPVVYVDWCDAHAYCAFSGRHLCGALEGGSLPISSAEDHQKGEWYNACSAQGVNTFPYGNDFQPLWCNATGALSEVPHTIEETEPNGTKVKKQRCQGGAVGLFEMSGNASEWIDACDAGGSCLAMGGAHNDPDPANLSCKAKTSQPRTTASPLIGFRCCL